MTPIKEKRPWQDPREAVELLLGFVGCFLLSRAALELNTLESLIRGFAGVGLYLAVSYAITRPQFFDYAVGEASPGTLGAIRALVCSRLFVMVISEDIASLASMPTSLRGHMGVMGLFYQLPIGFEHLLSSGLALRIFQAATLFFLFLGAIGWRSRLSVPLGGLGAFIVAGLLRQYTFFWHQDLICLYMIGVLSFTPCGDGFSLDRLIAVARGLPGPSAETKARIYGWARYTCWAVLALAYTAAGLSKLRNSGPFWWNGITMRRILLTDTLNPMQFNWGVSLHLAPLPEWFFALLGLAGVGGEALYGLVLVWPRMRKLFPLGMAMMHISIVFLQNILFLDLIILQVIFFDWTVARKAIGRWINAQRGTVEILFDGHCQLCVRTMEIARRLDLFGRLKLTDFRTSPPPASLTMDALVGEMHVLSNGKVYRGYESYRQLALVIPLGWILTPFLWIPGISAIGSSIYAKIASQRSGSLYCGTTHCRLEGHVRSNVAEIAPRATYRAALGAAGLISIMLFSWIFQIEYFPFTALQMYSSPKWKSTEPVIFFKMVAERESGDTSTTAFDAVVGGLFARNSRFRPFIKRCFISPEDAARCREFLIARGNAYNFRTAPGRRIKKIEVQKWSCDWKDPLKQELLDRFTVDF